MKIVIKNIEHTEKTGQSGKPYTSCRITVWNKKDGKDNIISGFGSGITKTWNAGDTVEIDLSQNDRGYWNWKENENTKPSENPVLVLLKEISRKLDFLSPTQPATIHEKTEIEKFEEDFGAREVVDNPPQETIEDEIRPEDIPF